jgi:hypothetical protein
LINLFGINGGGADDLATQNAIFRTLRTGRRAANKHAADAPVGPRIAATTTLGFENTSHIGYDTTSSKKFRASDRASNAQIQPWFRVTERFLFLGRSNARIREDARPATVNSSRQPPRTMALQAVKAPGRDRHPAPDRALVLEITTRPGASKKSSNTTAPRSPHSLMIRRESRQLRVSARPTSPSSSARTKLATRMGQIDAIYQRAGLDP